MDLGSKYMPADLAEMITTAQKRMIGLGLDPGPLVPATVEELRRLFTFVPAFYTISIDLDGDTGDNAAGSVNLRPEPFLMTRITWATDGDTPVFNGALALPGYSSQGRSVRVEWADEFTKFLGDRPAMISALFGDSQGFMDMQGLCLFQGKQTLSAKLTRLGWPYTSAPIQTSWDITFAGFGLLPKGVNQSGSAG
jgi:hypothetical protein